MIKNGILFIIIRDIKDIYDIQIGMSTLWHFTKLFTLINKLLVSENNLTFDNNLLWQSIDYLPEVCPDNPLEFYFTNDHITSIWFWSKV